MSKSASAAPAQGVPLCVDLDGTLVKSDTFLDSLCILLRTHPASLLRIPGWLISGGKAHVKAEVAAVSPLDATHLPYNQAVLHFLEEQHRLGRPIYLVTGADTSLASRVAAHLGLFSGVMASNGETGSSGHTDSVNLTGNRKLTALQHRFPAFDYIGNSRPDIPVLSHSRLAYIANPTLGLRMALKSRTLSAAQCFRDRRSLLSTVFKAIRTHQWAKNVLLFLPLLLSHQVSMKTSVAAIAAFFCFSFIASANYLINDLLDIENDRRHLKKRQRPFAAGDLAVSSGVTLVLLLIAASCAILPHLPTTFALWLLVYATTTSAYSFYLKRVPLVDVLVLSGLYAVRVLAGGAATNTFISPWLSGLAIFLFLSLAMVKRFSELANLRERGIANSQGRGYLVSDLEQIRAFGTASAYAAVVVFSLYISRPDVSALYRHSGRLWLIVPIMLYWLNRVWLLASRGELDEDPVVFAISDPVSLMLAAGTAVLAIFAMV
ncbi:UbiA family prenyltransferase [Acidicapsa acidisoli]|uniref:UbiA family prenyltransferase n=1 Tax=Acidicapsa acidisoli TaxID=1615681 RepID=UPI0021E0C9D9|nr:UbiA family prenyltransferase [Acidicapsa acidisoli]